MEDDTNKCLTSIPKPLSCSEIVQQPLHLSIQGDKVYNYEEEYASIIGIDGDGLKISLISTNRFLNGTETTIEGIVNGQTLADWYRTYLYNGR